MVADLTKSSISGTNLSGTIVSETPGAQPFAPDRCRRLVIKVGSSLLVGKTGAVRRDWLKSLIADIAQRAKAGQDVLLVSSGAVALGRRALGIRLSNKSSLEDRQAAAAVGQVQLAHHYSAMLATHGLQAAQLLFTLHDLEDRRRYLNVTATVHRLIELGAIPVINENDTVATTEIRFGDNDRLAARVAQAVRADGLIILSDVAGLYTGNPSKDPDARLIPVVDEITPHIVAIAGGIGESGMGSGGMASKVQAARIALSSGCHMAIASGTGKHPLATFQQSGIGTVFPAHEDAPGARKRWLAGRLTAAGTLTIDDGAVRALKQGKSLLAAGLRAVSGNFARGDVVNVMQMDGQLVARGLVGYDTVDAARICGAKSTDIADILGYAPRSCVIHTDDLVLMT